MSSSKKPIQLPLLAVPAGAERLRSKRERLLLDQIASAEIQGGLSGLTIQVELVGHKKRLGRALIARKLLVKAGVGKRLGRTGHTLPTLIVKLTVEGHARLRMLRAQNSAGGATSQSREPDGLMRLPL